MKLTFQQQPGSCAPRPRQRFDASRRYAPLAGRRRRPGSITIELLLNLPIWILLVLSMVQFGQLASSVQHVTRASRVGAELAAQCLALPAGGQVPSEILDAIQCQLASSGMACSQVILEHNLSDTPVTLVSGSGGGLPPASPLPGCGTYVRVTIFVPVAAIMPNLLGKMGVDLWSRAVEQSTTFRYQLQARKRP